MQRLHIVPQPQEPTEQEKLTAAVNTITAAFEQKGRRPTSQEIANLPGTGLGDHRNVREKAEADAKSYVTTIGTQLLGADGAGTHFVLRLRNATQSMTNRFCQEASKLKWPELSPLYFDKLKTLHAQIAAMAIGLLITSRG